MEKEKYKFELETTGDYDYKKEFSTVIELTPLEFAAFVNHILTFINNDLIK